MRNIDKLFPALLCGLALTARPVHANPTATITRVAQDTQAAPAPDLQEGTIAVGGEFLMQIRAEAEGKTVKQRADEVTERLPDILAEKTIKPRDIKAVPADKKQKDTNYKIMVKNHLLIVVTAADGKPNSRSAKQQAEDWVKQLRKTLPNLNAKPNPNIEKG